MPERDERWSCWFSWLRTEGDGYGLKGDVYGLKGEFFLLLSLWILNDHIFDDVPIL